MGNNNKFIWSKVNKQQKYHKKYTNSMGKNDKCLWIKINKQLKYHEKHTNLMGNNNTCLWIKINKQQIIFFCVTQFVVYWFLFRDIHCCSPLNLCIFLRFWFDTIIIFFVLRSLLFIDFYSETCIVVSH